MSLTLPSNPLGSSYDVAMAVDEARHDLLVTGRTDLVEADFAAATAALPDFRRGRQTLFIWGLLLLMFLACWQLLGEGGQSPDLLPIALPVAFTVVLAIFFQRAMRKGWVKQALVDQGGPTDFRFDDFGFNVDSRLRHHRLAWASLARWLETPEAFVVYTTPRTLLVVPKRAFAAPAVRQVRELLSTRITPAPARSGLVGGVRRTLVVWVLLVVAFLAIWHLLDNGQPPKQHSRELRKTPDAP